MAPIDILFLFGFLGIWIPQAFWAWLSYQAWKYSKTAEKELQNLPIPERWPVLSVLIPAYNEGVVIEDTLHAIAQQDYPAESYEVLLMSSGRVPNTIEIKIFFIIRNPYKKQVLYEYCCNDLLY